MKPTQKIHRGAVQKSDSTFIGAWVPDRLARLIDNSVVVHDLDRSKFIRAAIREKLEKEGMLSAA